MTILKNSLYREIRDKKDVLRKNEELPTKPVVLIYNGSEKDVQFSLTSSTSEISLAKDLRSQNPISFVLNNELSTCLSMPLEEEAVYSCVDGVFGVHLLTSDLNDDGYQPSMTSAMVLNRNIDSMDLDVPGLVLGDNSARVFINDEFIGNIDDNYTLDLLIRDIGEERIITKYQNGLIIGNNTKEQIKVRIIYNVPLDVVPTLQYIDDINYTMWGGNQFTGNINQPVDQANWYNEINAEMFFCLAPKPDGLDYDPEVATDTIGVWWDQRLGNTVYSAVGYAHSNALSISTYDEGNAYADNYTKPPLDFLNYTDIGELTTRVVQSSNGDFVFIYSPTQNLPEGSKRIHGFAYNGKRLHQSTTRDFTDNHNLLNIKNVSVCNDGSFVVMVINEWLTGVPANRIRFYRFDGTAYVFHSEIESNELTFVRDLEVPNVVDVAFNAEGTKLFVTAGGGVEDKHTTWGVFNFDKVNGVLETTPITVSPDIAEINIIANDAHPIWNNDIVLLNGGNKILSLLASDEEIIGELVLTERELYIHNIELNGARDKVYFTASPNAEVNKPDLYILHEDGVVASYDLPGHTANRDTMAVCPMFDNVIAIPTSTDNIWTGYTLFIINEDNTQYTDTYLPTYSKPTYRPFIARLSGGGTSVTTTLYFGASNTDRDIEVTIPGYGGEIFTLTHDASLNDSTHLLELENIQVPAEGLIITVRGGFSANSLSVYGEHLTGVIDWGDVVVNQFNLNALSHYRNYELSTHSPLFNELPNTLPSSVTSIYGLFAGIKNLQTDISKYDTKNVLDMGYAFRMSDIDQDISGWNVSSTSNMDSMFSVSKITADLRRWCVTNIYSEPTDFNLEGILPLDNYPSWGNCPLELAEATLVNETGVLYLNQFEERLVKFKDGLVHGNYYVRDVSAVSSDESIVSISEDPINVNGVRLTPKALGTVSIEFTVNRLYTFTKEFTVVEPFEPLIAKYDALYGPEVAIGGPNAISYIDWGDGTPLQRTSGASRHTYADTVTEATVTVSFYGRFDVAEIHVQGGLTEVVQWHEGKTTKYLMGKTGTLGTSSVAKVPDHIWPGDTIELVNTFANNLSINDPNISKWDVTNVRLITTPFEGAVNFNQPLTSWNTVNAYNYMLSNSIAVLDEYQLKGANKIALNHYNQPPAYNEYKPHYLARYGVENDVTTLHSSFAITGTTAPDVTFSIGIRHGLVDNEFTKFTNILHRQTETGDGWWLSPDFPEGMFTITTDPELGVVMTNISGEIIEVQARNNTAGAMGVTILDSTGTPVVDPWSVLFAPSNGEIESHAFQSGDRAILLK